MVEPFIDFRLAGCGTWAQQMVMKTQSISFSICLAISAAALAITACTPSPLYVSKRQPGTGGEVPRDGRGEPIWSAIPPRPVAPAADPAAPASPAAALPKR
jgi:hypothetical protein